MYAHVTEVVAQLWFEPLSCAGGERVARRTHALLNGSGSCGSWTNRFALHGSGCTGAALSRGICRGRILITNVEKNARELRVRIRVLQRLIGGQRVVSIELRAPVNITASPHEPVGHLVR